MRDELRRELFALQDLGYKEFQCKLMPTVNRDTVIGVRTPELRKLAKAFGKTQEAAAFLRSLPHSYYEENNVHGFMISEMKDPEETIAALDRFLPYVDNWATCDLISPKSFKNHPPQVLEAVRRWMGDKHPYTVRFGIGVLLGFYLDDAFQPEHLDWVADLRGEAYYVNMMVAWYFATALAKQYDAALPYLEQHRLADWTHNKAIQKAIESYRVSDGQKAYLRTLKIGKKA